MTTADGVADPHLRHPLGRSDVLVSRLGVGTMTWGDTHGWASRMHPAHAFYGGSDGLGEEQHAVRASLRAGVVLFDTAAMYSAGGSELRLGVICQSPEAVIATKFPPRMRARPEDVPYALADSLDRLQRPVVDLYQHHFPMRSSDIRLVMNAMADAVHAGKVRAVGVSNYNSEQMRTAYQVLADRGVPLASNQVQYSLLHRNPERNGVLEACRELGVTLLSYQPLASGALTGKYVAARPKGMRRFLMPQFRRGQRDSVTRLVSLLREIGDRYGRTPAQVALRWLIEDPVVVPIPGAKNGAQAAANAEALTFRLTGDEVAELSAATR